MEFSRSIRWTNISFHEILGISSGFMGELWWRPTSIHGRWHQTPPNISAGKFGFVERSIPRFIDDSGGSFEVLTAQSRCTCSANKTWRVLWRARERKVSSVSSVVREVIDIIDRIYRASYPIASYVPLTTNPNSPNLSFEEFAKEEKRKETKRIFAWNFLAWERTGSGIKLRSNSRCWDIDCRPTGIRASAISRKPERKEAGRYQ